MKNPAKLKGLNLKEVKQVEKIVNKNKKYKMQTGHGLYAYGGTSNAFIELYNSSGSTTLGLDAIDEGTESYNRQGDTIMLVSYKIRLHLILDRDIFLATPVITTPNPVGFFRIVVVRLFGAYSGTVADYFSGTQNIDSQFIVEQGTVLFDTVQGLSTSLDNKVINFNVPCKTKKIPHVNIQYDDADTPNVTKNDIKVFICGTNQSGALTINVQDYKGYYDKY